MGRHKTLFDDEKHNMADDPLKLLMKVLGWRLLNNRIIKMFLISGMAGIQICNVAALYLIKNNDNLSLHKYLTIPLLSQPGFLGLLVMMQCFGELSAVPIINNELSWTINVAGMKVEKRILRECKIARIVAISIFLVSIVTHMGMVLPLVGNEDEFDSAKYIIEHYFHSYSQLLLVIYYSVAFCLAWGVAYSVTMFVYLLLHLKFQLYLLNEHLSRISEDYMDVKGTDLVYNEGYQDVIYRRLTLCCAQHVNIKKLKDYYVSICKFSMLYLPIGSLAPALAGYFIVYDISPRSNFRMVIVMILFVLLVLAMCIPGQHFQDNSEEIFNVASKCPWLYWNNKNKNALLLLLDNSLEPLSYSSYTTIALNFRLIFSFHKWAYSLITLIYS